jgi:hypothetical protein
MVNYEALKDIEITDESEDPNQGGGSINEIILRQMKKIGDICSKELTGGYWQKKPMKTSGGVIFTEEYHEDLREAYCNSVEFIIDLVYAISDEDFMALVKAEKEESNILLRLKAMKKMFRQINIMFERTGFFSRTENKTFGGSGNR